MKTSDFERLLREDLHPQFFPAEEDKWLKLEKDLHRPKPGILVFSGKTWMAAAVVLLLFGSALYKIYTPGKTTSNKVTRSATISKPAMLPSQNIRGTVMEETLPAIVRAPRQNSGLPIVKGEKARDCIPAYPENADTIAIVNVVTADKQDPPKRGEVGISRPDPPFSSRNEPPALRSFPGLTIGLSALYGYSAAGNSQYRISVDARKDISERLFANVQMVASGGRLSVSNTHQYQVFQLGPTGGDPEISTRDDEALYSGNVYAIGITPSIGIRISQSLAVSAGPDLQKLLATSVPLTNKEVFRNQISNQSVVEDKKEIPALDLGLQSTVQLKLNPRLGVNLTYRYGLTDYLRKSSGSYRNSFMGIGLSYRFTR